MKLTAKFNKKNISTILICVCLLASVSLTGCGSTESENTSNSNNVQDKVSEITVPTEDSGKEEAEVSSDHNTDIEPTSTPEKNETSLSGLSVPVCEDGVTTWDTVYFGSYYQSKSKETMEPIRWRVLSVDGDDAFLFADKNLEFKKYNENEEHTYDYTDAVWETCTLRKWLNEDFYNMAFNNDEKNVIMETMVVNEDNPKFGTEGGNNTKDKLYLLSIAEVSNAAYGFDAEFNYVSKTREAKNTDYAIFNAKYSTIDNKPGVNSSWWLRSPGENSIDAAYVDCDGAGSNSGYYVNSGYGRDYRIFAVRPALHINLSSSTWEYAGKVSSEDETP